MVKSDIGRYAIVPEWLLMSVSNGTAIRLFAILAAKYVDREGQAWPSRKTLGQDLGVSVDTIDRATRDLIAAGALEVQQRLDEEGDQTSNLYVLRFTPGGGRTDAATGGRTDAALTRPIRNQEEEIAKISARKQYEELLKRLPQTTSVVQQPELYWSAFAGDVAEISEDRLKTAIDWADWLRGPTRREKSKLRLPVLPKGLAELGKWIEREGMDIDRLDAEVAAGQLYERHKIPMGDGMETILELLNLYPMDYIDLIRERK